LTERLRPSDHLWRGASLLLALGGVAGFVLIFVRHMNVYWFILSPIILSVYEIPAVMVYGTWKKRRDRRLRKPDLTEPEEAAPAAPADDIRL
jgi:hypothetical protein